MSSPRILGIRHHGPGSARSLLAELERNPLDLILIEGPPDAEALLPAVADPAMQPPVALLVYNPKNLRQASFFPFAEFSPEWQAILFGLRHGIPIRFMDLPMSLTFALRPDEDAPAQLALEMFQSTDPAAADPFGEIARLAGYSDPERWWEAMFERRAGDGEREIVGATLVVVQGATDPGSIGTPSSRATTRVAPTEEDNERDSVFAVVLDLMRALRESKAAGGFSESRETLLREAYMRQSIRQAEKEGFQNIAVVCGAWHGPALADVGVSKPATDAALLKGLKKVKTEATWIPWSFDRLANQSGYGAGVLAPAWYREIWAGDSELVRWFSKAAQLLRREDLGAPSSAHIIEAIRLADALAALRQTALPGIEELREAAVTVLCEGAEAAYRIIEQELVVGDVLGAVPDSVPVVPLRADFEAQVRSARLKISTGEQSLALDLREEAHLRKSRLLHRLDLLRIPWGKTEAVSGRKEGGFHEHWTLSWLPDYEIRLIEAGAWGNTVESAAARLAQRRIRDTEHLPDLVTLLDAVLKADLPAALPPLLGKLRSVGALAQDALALADTLLPLVQVLRYGHARRMDLPAIEQLLEQIAPRVCIALPAACMGINEEAAAEVLKRVLATNRALHLWRPEAFAGLWQQALAQIAGSGVPILAGVGTRLLFEQKAKTAGETAVAMRYRLSHAQPPMEAAQWLEGFLHGSGLLLLHQPVLWQILDDWVRGVPEPDFPELLPLLRRTFSRFSGPEREKMLDLARSGSAPREANYAEKENWDEGRAALVRPLLGLILSE
ncbi:MAG: hypothetical protein JNJ90_13915 [Saprospiraceae bacterium]|jgi:hypothetical protein|nr:hypothetical protein [Saprospiraceae bacterium]